MAYDGSKAHDLYFVVNPTHKSCQRCGKADCYLGIHHPLQRSLFPKREYDVTNMILLCNECHNLCHPEGVVYTRLNKLQKEYNKLMFENIKIKNSRTYIKLNNKLESFMNYIVRNYPKISIPHQFT